MTGRTFRAIVGVVVILADLAVFVSEHIFHEGSWEMMQLAGHALFLFLGLLLIDATMAKQFITSLPTLRKKE